MGDDDILNFDRCQDFIEAIESEKYNLIICNSAIYTSEDSPNKLTIDDETLSEYLKRHKKN